MRSPIGYDDYRRYLKDVIEDNAQVRGFQGSLAQAAKCQKSYFSQALRGKTNLTPEQALRISAFLKLDDDQTEVFMLLVDLSRTSSTGLINRLKMQLQQILQRREDLARRYDMSMVETKGNQLYYSSWHWIAVHMATSIPSLQTVTSIAEHLSLRKEMVETTLAGLKDMGLIKRDGDRWHTTQVHFHLPKESPLIVGHHVNWRQQANLDAQLKKAQSLHYTVVQSHGIADYSRLKEDLLATLDRHRAVVAASPEEQLSCLCIDFFQV